MEEVLQLVDECVVSMEVCMKSKIFLWIATLFIFTGQIAIAYAVPYGSRVCRDNPNVPCLTVKRGDTWSSLWPDPMVRNEAMRLNRMNTRVYPGLRLINPEQMTQSDIIELLPFAQNIETNGERTILISPRHLAWVAYDTDGNIVRWGPASTGKSFCPDIHSRCMTPRGSFTIYRKQGADCESSKFPIPYGGAPMPYCMFFKGGFALHGSNALPGYNASHGCARILTADARWLNQNFVSVGDTRVIVSDRYAQEN